MLIQKPFGYRTSIAVAIFTFIFFLSLYIGTAEFVEVLILFALMYYIGGKERILFGYVTVIRVVGLIVTSSWMSTHFHDGLLPNQPDQHFYLTTARSISSAIQHQGAWIDYKQIVGLHNDLYNILLGWLNIFSVNDLLSIRLVNCIFVTATAILAGRMAGRLYGKKFEAVTMVIVSLLPTLNLFSLAVMRDDMIALLTMMFFWALIEENYMALAVSMTLMYYLRIQETFMFLAIGIALILGRITERIRVFRRHSTLSSMAIILSSLLLGYLSTFIFERLAFIRKYVNLYTLLGYLHHVVGGLLGLDFLWTSSTIQSASRIHLLLAHLVMPDAIIVPLVGICSILFCLRVPSPVLRFRVAFILFVAMYDFGYYIQYGTTFIRVLLPLYPLFFVAALPLLTNFKRVFSFRTKGQEYQ